MKYCVEYGHEYYGTYGSWAKAFFFALENFGFNGWRIYGEQESK